MDGFMSQAEQQSNSQNLMYQQMLQAQMQQAQALQMAQYQQIMQAQQSQPQYSIMGCENLPRYTKGQIYSMIQQYCMQNTGKVSNKLEKIDEAPEFIRHSCFSTGVVALPKMIYQLQSRDGLNNIPYYCCDKCGKVYICTEYI